MPEVTEDTFLGDIISSDGKNTKNIKSRISKGIGIVTNIFNLLESISLGPYIFKVALLLSLKVKVRRRQLNMSKSLIRDHSLVNG